MANQSSDIQFLNQRYDEAIAEIADGHLRHALECIASLVQACNETTMRLEYENIRSSYEAMLTYFASAQKPDASRHAIRRELMCKTYSLACRLWHRLREAKNDFFNLARREARQHTGGESFESLWTADLWNTDDEPRALLRQIEGESSEAERCLLVAGVTMSLLEAFDLRKLQLLATLYNDSPDSETGLRAFAGAVIATNHNRGIIAHSEAARKLITGTLLATPQSHADLFALQLQMFHCRDTKAITQHMNKEIIPDLLRQSNEMGRMTDSLGRKLDIADLSSALDSELASNPEWKERSQKLNDHISWIHRQQREGADIYHATFATSKNYTFFTRMANWLRPFDAHCSDIAAVTLDANGNPRPFIQTIIGGSLFCSSDAYSFCLMLSTMPRSMTESMLSQMGSMSDAATATTADLDTAEKRRTVISHYMQDMYRLRTLAPFREALPDLFGREANFTACRPLADTLSLGTDGESNMNAIANYLMDNGHYDDALGFFAAASPQSQTLECMALCHHKLGHIDQALDLYHKAGGPEGSRWRTDMIARCHISQSRPDEALKAIMLFEGWADDTQLLARAARIHAQQGRFGEALKLYFKLDYVTDSRSPQAQRGVAWCALATGDYATAQRYYAKLMAGKPSQNDILNAAHTQLLLSDYAGAVGLYRRASAMATTEPSTQLSALIDADTAFLTSKGISPSDLKLIVDAATV